jgi:hypothetical protein
MNLKSFFGLIFFIIVILLLVVYWFVPLSTKEFILTSGGFGSHSGNFSNSSTQFYPNMRFPDSRISYKISDCPLQKRDDMLKAFDIMANLSILKFYSVDADEEINVVCDSHAKIEGGLFIAGEGGPLNITQAGDFYVISKGKILLLKESSCPEPNIAIHELLHVLGFDHVNNPDDIMYPVSMCDQIINPKVIATINDLYLVPSQPDLTFENISAIMKGKYLDVNMSVRNIGLNDSNSAQINIYADEKLVKELDLESLMIGHGRVITLTNVWVNKMSVDELIFEIVANFSELKKENNKIILKIKNKN